MDEIDRRITHKGRGTLSNAVGRFEGYERLLIDDGWGNADAPALPLETVLTEDTTRTIISRNKSPDIPFDRSINPYRGCEHGCVYCFARPTHAYLGLSPGLDFESRIFFKPRAAELLAQELSAPSYRCAPLALGTNTDPYQPVERKLGIMRGILEVLRDYRHPVTIVSKSALIQRDLDILAPMAAERMAFAAISITTLDRKLARLMEPRAATPERRLETVAALARAGIPVAVLAAPMIPGLNDHELETILEAAKSAGASRAGWVLLRLPLELEVLFREWLETHVPMRAAHVLSLVRQTRGGKYYRSGWGERLRGGGPYAELIGIRFENAAKKLGFDQSREHFRLDTSRFKPPPKKGDQLALF